jgi:hypothetical protein
MHPTRQYSRIFARPEEEMRRTMGRFLLSELPDYKYPINLACPTCYKPLENRGRRDGRCDECLKSKDLLPVNWRRPPKRKQDEDEKDYEYE